jgi:3-deoxy-manno-octulosonate cytidylyltransferase (CMP-KDO synthetase)
MAILAVIPARMAATRLPGKPLRSLGGEPLVIRVWQRVMALGVADECVIATESEAVAEAARHAGAAVALTSDRHPSGTDRVAEVAGQAPYRRFETIVNVQGDEPFVARDAVRGATDLVSRGTFPIGTASATVGADALARPDVVKVVCADDGRALYFSRAPIPFLRDAVDTGDRDANVRQHIGVYAYSRAALSAWVALPTHPLERIERLEQLRPLAAGMPIGVAHTAAPVHRGIDTEEDLTVANAHWTAFTAARS